VVIVGGCTEQQKTQPTTITSTGEIKEFQITASQFSFEPNIITVNKGDTVKLKIKSVDVTHGFTINEFGVNEKLEPGKMIDVEFVAGKTGAFSFYCSIFCGNGHSGMRGELVVK